MNSDRSISDVAGDFGVEAGYSRPMMVCFERSCCVFLALATAVALSGIGHAQMPEAAVIEIDQTFEYRQPSHIMFIPIENFDLPVLDYVEDMFFAAGIEPMYPEDGDVGSTLHVEIRGRASGGTYLEPSKAYLYTGVDLAGEINITGPDGATASGVFTSTIQRPFQLTLNLGYEDPANAPFMRALEQPAGFIEQLCYAMASAWGVESILPSLLEDEAAIRFATASALGNIGDPIAVPDLIVALVDEHDRVRWESAWSLGRIGDVRAVSDLIEALKDKSQDVRWFASWSLRTITGEDLGTDYDTWLAWWESQEAPAQG